MARLPLVDPDDPGADPTAAALLHKARERQQRGTLPWRSELNVQAAIANHPELLEAFGVISRVAYSGNSLTPGQRELCWLAASFENRCHY